MISRLLKFLGLTQGLLAAPNPMQKEGVWHLLQLRFFARIKDGSFKVENDALIMLPWVTFRCLDLRTTYFV